MLADDGWEWEWEWDWDCDMVNELCPAEQEENRKTSKRADKNRSK